LQQAHDYTALHQWKGTGGEKSALKNAAQALDFFGPDTPVSEIIATEVARYMTHLIEHRDNSPATRNKKMSALRVMLSNAEDYGNLAALPKMKRVKEKRQEPAWFRPETEAEMLAVCERLGYADLRDFIIIGIDTGFRSGELLSLTLDQHHGGAFVLPEGFTKNGMPRRIPDTARVASIVAQRRVIGQRRIFPSLTQATLRGQWEDLRCHMGKEDDPMFTPHKLRHTCATRMVAAGVHLKTVQKWMGHEVIETTMRYAHLADDAVDAARDQMARQQQPPGAPA
jgi:integrase